MLSLELKNLSPAPNILDRLSAQKNRSIEVAAVMPAKYRQRMEQCNEWVKVRTFANGYQKIDRSNLCRVRGCPVCEMAEYRKTMGKIVATIKSSKRLHPSSGIVVVSLDSEQCKADQINETIEKLSNHCAKVCRRKSFPSKVWARFMSLHPVNNSFFIRCTLIVLPIPVYFGGKKYLKKSDWVDLCGMDVRTICYRYNHGNGSLEKIIKACADIVKSSFFDFLSIDPNLVEPVSEQIHNQRFRNFSQAFSDAAERPERKEYPSTKKLLMNSSTAFSIFAPDVLGQNFDEEKYVQVEDFHFDSVFDDIQMAIL